MDGQALATENDLDRYDFCGKLDELNDEGVSNMLERMKCAEKAASQGDECDCPIKCKEYQYRFNSFQVYCHCHYV